jgi:GDP-L-fucose synthase
VKILVTGATGFVGQNLVQRLREDGHDVAAVSTAIADLTEQSSLNRFCDQSFDRIYHLAAWTRAGDFCLSHQGDQWIINQLINTNVLTWWHRHQPQALMIAIGSSCTYAPTSDFKEESLLLGLPTPDLFSYAMTKRMLYAGVISLHQQFGHSYLFPTPATVYGPGYHTDGRQMHFIFDLISKIIRGKWFGEPVVLWGDGNQKRELIFLNDFVECLIQLPRIACNEAINVGAGTEYSIREYAAMICELVGFDIHDIKFDLDRYVGVRSKCLNISKLNQLMPDAPRTSLREGLRQTIQWMEPELAQARAKLSSSTS